MKRGISQLSVIPGKKAKGIKRCGHIERMDQRVARDRFLTKKRVIYYRRSDGELAEPT